VLDALHASMLHWYRLVGAGSEGAHTLERDGVVAALVPASAERSVVNAVVYERPEALAAAYDDVAAAYDEIGAKWTVWVHAGDGETAALLERKGHVLDGEPEAMAADLAATPPRRPTGDALADWTADGDLADVGAINDRAYGYGGDWFSRALTDLPAGEVQLYVARRDGEAVGCSAIVDNGTNCEVQMVAVVPEARGSGISGKLIAHGLADAVERGARTATLVATQLGRPVYERLGFEPLGTLQMWERRLDQR
jgi:N-acetylglutamate synthase-like GNAT family acetyltransferase